MILVEIKPDGSGQMSIQAEQFKSKGKRRSKEQLAEFEQKIIQFRRNGISFEKIAQITGDSLSNCHKAYQRACARLPTTDLEEMRLFLDQQLEEVFHRSMMLAQKGSVPALGQALQALAQRAKLFGLNEPVTTKIELTGIKGSPIKTEQGVTAQDIEEMTDAERATIRRIAERQIKRNNTRH